MSENKSQGDIEGQNRDCDSRGSTTIDPAMREETREGGI
jgi:hypothetical protein